MSGETVLALVGATASGKSTLGHRLAQRVGGEIVNCDSVQVYRGFEIGCAKATAAQREEVPYHLLDVAEWHEGFDAHRYCELALAAIGDIRKRGRRPIVVGGTGLYLRMLRWGEADLPRADAALRAQLEADEAQVPGVLRARLRELDPRSACTITAGNSRQVLRALEICLLTGKAASALREKHRFASARLSMDVVVLERGEALAERIRARTQWMLANGLLEEARRLLAAGVSPTCTAMASIGYKQVVELLAGRIQESELADTIAARTRQYAKRQRTWWKKDRDPRAGAMADDETKTLEAILRV